MSGIVDCYNTGNVNGSGDYIVQVGGICGSVGSYYTISQCYNVGTILGEHPVSVLADINGICADYNWGDGIEIINCYSLNANNSTMGTLLSQADLQNASVLIGFDFDSIWAISPDINEGYPHLIEVDEATNIRCYT